jgi:Flp pilus assembly protein CpaB
VPLLLLGLLIMLGAGVGFAVWSADLSERETVLVAARDLDAGDVVTENDVRTVDLGGATQVDALPESVLDVLVGTTAVADVKEGTVLNDGMFVEGGAVAAGEAVVGVVLEPGAVPVPQLRPNDRVQVVRLGSTEVTAEDADEIAVARVLTTRGVSETSTARAVSLVVPDGAALEVADAAGAGRIWLVLLPS